MDALKRVLSRIDRWQRAHKVAAVAYGVTKKFGDDEANLLVVALGWYGFTAIYPLLLVVVTVFGYIGAASLGNGIVSTLHEFPVIGAQFNPGAGSSNLHGSPFGLVVGVLGLVYGAQGVTQSAQQAMSQVWNIPRFQLPGFLARLGRSLAGLAIIGGAFVINALVGSLAVGYGPTVVVRVPLVAALVLLNVGLYLAAFRVLTPGEITSRSLRPGAIVGGVGFTLLTTVGAGLVQHQLRHSSSTYGAFGSVIGVVAFLLLLGKLSIYAAELNPVLARRLWPRALPGCPPTEADDRMLRDLAHQERGRPDERVGVGFEPSPSEEAAVDAQKGGG